MPGLQLIAEERQRQIDKGYTADHDDGVEADRQIARAANAYLDHYVRRAWVFTNEFGLPGVANGPESYRNEPVPDDWPWEDKDWKPTTPLSDLIKAGALIAAEIERVQRRAEKK